MKTSTIFSPSGHPTFCVDGQLLPACAYITYFDERNNYKDFAAGGIRLFSVTISFAAQPINTTSGIMPHRRGVFDSKGKPDFSLVDETIGKILEAVPDAYIFPRVFINMPEWWIAENPDDTTPVPRSKRRESLYSDKFRADAAQMLRELIAYCQIFPAKDHIFGYQLSGGNTQEWFHMDLNGSHCDESLLFFNAYLKKEYPHLYPAASLPSLTPVHDAAVISDELLTAYLRFANEEIAETVDFFCKVAKEACNREKIVGAFYGYTTEVCDPLWGTHAIGKLLESENIDFFSSPNSYMNNRALGIDWGDMMPVNSIQLHGKLCFMECDIRTFLSRAPEDSRPGSDPDRFYRSDVWFGPPTEELSVYAMRKSLARQLTHKHGLWWFDMFGHWYATEKLMNEAKTSVTLCRKAFADRAYETKSEVAVFLDEKSLAYIGQKHPAYYSPYQLRTPLGAAGVPYDVFLIDDFVNIDWKNTPYKAVIFNIPHDAAYLADYSARLGTLGIRSLAVSAQKPTYSTVELLRFFASSGVFIYCKSQDVFYIGNGFAGIHAATSGLKIIQFPQKVRCIDCESGELTESDHLQLSLKKFETRLFQLETIR